MWLSGNFWRGTKYGIKPLLETITHIFWEHDSSRYKQVYGLYDKYHKEHNIQFWLKFGRIVTK